VRCRVVRNQHRAARASVMRMAVGNGAWHQDVTSRFVVTASVPSMAVAGFATRRDVRKRCKAGRTFAGHMEAESAVSTKGVTRLPGGELPFVFDMVVVFVVASPVVTNLPLERVASVCDMVVVNGVQNEIVRGLDKRERDIVASMLDIAHMLAVTVKQEQRLENVLNMELRHL